MISWVGSELLTLISFPVVAVGGGKGSHTTSPLQGTQLSPTPVPGALWTW